MECFEYDWSVQFCEGTPTAAPYHNPVLVSFINQMDDKELLTIYF